MSEPRIVDRRHEALGGQKVDRPVSAIKTIVWHYTATLNSFITNHERFWQNTYGWDRGGYHYYISRDGTIYWNYNHERITWGVANNNYDTVHMSLEASRADNYTPEQIKSRDWLTRKLMKELNIKADNVKGHYEVYNNTSCPGYTRAEMDNFRRQLAKAPVVESAKVHKVQSGDTLWAISKRYGTSVDELKRLNGLDSNLIVVGQNLVISGVPVADVPKLRPLDEVAQDVIDGKYGNYPGRKTKLEAEGYNYNEVQAVVDRLVVKKNLLPMDAVVEKVLAGEYGNYPARKTKLEAEGYDYAEVQAAVDAQAKANKPKPTPKQYVYLPSNNKTWRVYPLDKSPVIGNERGLLAPATYGGLKYEVLGWSQKDVAIIQTQDLGRVKIYVGPDTNARISIE